MVRVRICECVLNVFVTVVSGQYSVDCCPRVMTVFAHRALMRLDSVITFGVFDHCSAYCMTVVMG